MKKSNSDEWIEKVRNYCLMYDIPIVYLPEIINEPKVIPMVRGKAFEFSVLLRLQEILPKSIWTVDKPVMNAQFGLHDMDVRLTHNQTQKVIRIECKLAGKGSFRTVNENDFLIKVKCMRSRTLGDSRVKDLAPKIGVPESLLKVHNDQYVPSDFDVVITSIGNAFYETNGETDLFEWTPTEDGIRFLKNLSGKENINDLQHFAYNRMYVATSESLAITEGNGIKCTRKGCTKQNTCGFIPNYPVIKFESNFKETQNSWVSIEKSEELFMNLINKLK